jgi:hypothetical protein
MAGRKALMARKVAVRLPAIEAFHSSGSISSTSAGRAKLPPEDAVLGAQE